MIPALGPLSIVGLIFGGCCSNVFALEAIVRYEKILISVLERS